MIAKRHKAGLEKSKEFIFTQIRLLENAVLEQGRRNIFAVNGNRYVESRYGAMKQPRVTSLLVVNVEPRAQ